MDVNPSLKEYIQKNILPIYDNNYIGDGVERIEYVLRRAEEIIQENSLDVNDNILYTVICCHDIRFDNCEENHEIRSAKYMLQDAFFNRFFNKDELTIIKEAIEDQRAQFDGRPRNIYGEILSSASRNCSIEQCFERSYAYGKKKNPELSDEQIFENAYEALNKKFGNNGYAKFYFKDEKYDKFITEIRHLLTNKNKFIAMHKHYVDSKRV